MPKIKIKEHLLPIAAHVAFWLVLTLFYYISHRLTGRLEYFWSSTAIIMPIDLLAVYFTAYFLVPRYLMRQKWEVFGLYFTLSVAAFLLLERAAYYYVITPYVYGIKQIEESFLFFPALFGIFIGTYSFVFLFCGVRLFRGWLQDKRRHLELEQQHLESELRMLRSQINPHFIFNTLNNIDALVYIDQDRASDAIVRLSEIMRYMLYESNAEFVSLEKEVYYLRSMIDLIRLRLKDPEFIQFSVQGDTRGKVIPPMLLVPFVENAYKHGRKSGSGPGITIKLRIDDQRYQFEVRNEYDPNHQEAKDELGGIGLRNVERRLQLIFQDQHDFIISDTPPNFGVFVEIPAKSHIASEQKTKLQAKISYSI